MTTSPFDLSGRSALVTGGTSGIGLAIAQGLLAAGARVVVGSSSEAKVRAAEAQFVEPGGQGPAEGVAVTRLDVTDRGSVEGALALCAERFGRVDILINCAGVNLKKPTLELTDEEHRHIMEVNYFGAFHACQAFARRCGKQGDALEGGYAIVNVCSVGSFMGLEEVTAYAASKGALLALTRQLAVEWVRTHGIRVNALVPGFIPGEQNRAILKSGDRGRRILENTPMERFGSPQEIAPAAVYLCSVGARFVNGACLTVDGGFMAHGVSQAEGRPGSL